VQGTLPLAGAARAQPRWVALARPAGAVQSLLTLLSFIALLHAFAVNDFSVDVVAQHSNSRLPLPYRLAGTWGEHEGSMLLWVTTLGLWTLAVVRWSGSLPQEVAARVIAVLGLLSAGFLGFVLLASNPFDRTLQPPADGRDLNPLLQDPGMVAHPPLLYLGYVGFSVVFAFAIAALLGGRVDAAWTRWVRPWTLAAWSFLTAGILLGSFWAYYELGWGGWWFWDAVENASFMPWLVGTALIHSLAVTEKRGTFRHWTVLLAILAFSLSLLGTFLVRSGVLTSVHAFAADPRRGLYVLVFLVVVVGSSLTLYAWRAPGGGLAADERSRWRGFSREALLLLNNVLLMVVAATVLLGTLYPLVLDALGLGRISVGPPYFETVLVPLFLPLLLLLGLGPLLAWRRDDPRTQARRLAGTALASVALAGGVALAWRTPWLTACALAAAAWVLLATVRLAVRSLRAPESASLWQRARRLPGSHWGMLVAHLGVAVFVIGVALVRGTEVSQDVSLAPGQQATAGDLTLDFLRLTRLTGPNYVAMRAEFEVRRGSQLLARLAPEKRFYTVQQMPMTEAAIDRGLWRDLYLSLGEKTADQRWIVRVQVKPFMGWVWAGVLLMVLGGLVAAADRRYRRRTVIASTGVLALPPDAMPSSLPLVT
jgi:cytochrome c-type biogenesis protein CcmF